MDDEPNRHKPFVELRRSSSQALSSVWWLAASWSTQWRLTVEGGVWTGMLLSRVYTPTHYLPLLDLLMSSEDWMAKGLYKRI